MTRDPASKGRRGFKPRRILCAWASMLLCATLASGCAGTFTRHHHFDHDGPLSASTGEGGNILAQEERVRYVSFGANFLCMREEGTKAVIERVTYRTVVRPLKVEFWIRTFDLKKPAKNLVHPDGATTGFYSEVGRPPHFKGGTQTYAGTYTRRVSGTKITMTCEERGKVGFIDLIVAMKVDKRGGMLDGLTIEYRVGVRKYALDTRWQMGACGTAAMPQEHRDYCSGEKSE